MTLNVESGFKNFRIEYVAEASTGVAPANPTYLLFADRMRSINVQSEAGIAPLRFLGDSDVDSFVLGAEDASIAFEYAQEDRDLTGDILEDAITRNADNNLSASFTVVVREERTLDVGLNLGGSRVYSVGKGGFITSFNLAGELDPPEPLIATSTLTFEKVRSYRVDQPLATTLIGFKSSSAADVTQSVTIESDGTPATVDQTAAVAGITYVSMGVTTYASMDSISLDLECAGDIIVSINTGTDAAPVEGAVLCTIRGSTYYGGGEGDLGIPPLGTGAHASAIAGTFATLSGSTILWSAAALADVVVSSADFSTDNMIGGQVLPTAGTRRKKILVGGTEHIANANVVGEFASHANIDDHLGGTAATFTWKISATGSNKTINLTGTIKQAVPRVYDQSAAMEIGLSFQGKALTIV